MMPKVSTIVGVEEGVRYDIEGKVFEGVRVHFTTESKKFDGEEAENKFFQNSFLNANRWLPEVGQKVIFSRNSRGKIDEVDFA